MKNPSILSKRNIILAALVIFICILAAIFYKPPDNPSNYSEDNRGSRLEQLIEDFNKKNPDYSISSETLHKDLNWKYTTNPKNIQSIELISGQDGTFTITLDTYDIDKTALGKYFVAFLSIFLSNASAEQLDSIWADLSSVSHKDTTVDNVELTYNDSGEKETLGKPYFKWVKIHGSRN